MKGSEFMSYVYKVTKQKLEDDPELLESNSWYEGYLSALANHSLISESEFDELMNMLNPKWDKVSSIINDTCDMINQSRPLWIRAISKLGSMLSVFKN